MIIKFSQLKSHYKTRERGDDIIRTYLRGNGLIVTDHVKNEAVLRTFLFVLTTGSHLILNLFVFSFKLPYFYNALCVSFLLRHFHWLISVTHTFILLTLFNKLSL